MSNPTLGLMVALRALRERSHADARDVIVPSFTFAAVADAIVWRGLEPVFANLDPTTWHLGSETLELAREQRNGHVATVLACSTFGTAPRSRCGRVGNRPAPLWQSRCLSIQLLGLEPLTKPVGVSAVKGMSRYSHFMQRSPLP